MKNIASCTRAALLIILALSGAIIPFARAQTFGSVTGTVKDSSGAVVVGAKVTAENIANGVARTVPSNQRLER